MIVHSPAFIQDGLPDHHVRRVLAQSAIPPTAAFTVFDGTACCNEPSGPNTQLPGVPDVAASFGITITGSVGNSGGGQTGTVLVSTFIKPGTVSMVGYNHYNTLRSIEDFFGLAPLGYAGYPGTGHFGADVFGATIQKYGINL